MTNKFKYFQKGIELRGETADPSDNIEGSVFHNSTSSRLKTYIEAAVREVITSSQAQALTNKTLVVSSNTITTAASGNLAATELNAALAELQGDIDGRQATITGGASTIVSSNLTVSKALVSDGSGKVATSAVTATELGQLAGITSTVVGISDTQTLSNKTFGDAIIGTHTSTPSTPAVGYNKLYFKSDKSLYTLDSDGTEAAVGGVTAGGGGGGSDLEGQLTDAELMNYYSPAPNTILDSFDTNTKGTKVNCASVADALRIDAGQTAATYTRQKDVSTNVNSVEGIVVSSLQALAPKATTIAANTIKFTGDCAEFFVATKKVIIAKQYTSDGEKTTVGLLNTVGNIAQLVVSSSSYSSGPNETTLVLTNPDSLDLSMGLSSGSYNSTLRVIPFDYQIEAKAATAASLEALDITDLSTYSPNAVRLPGENFFKETPTSVVSQLTGTCLKWDAVCSENKQYYFARAAEKTAGNFIYWWFYSVDSGASWLKVSTSRDSIFSLGDEVDGNFSHVNHDQLFVANNGKAFSVYFKQAGGTNQVYGIYTDLSIGTPVITDSPDSGQGFGVGAMSAGAVNFIGKVAGDTVDGSYIVVTSVNQSNGNVLITTFTAGGSVFSQYFSAPFTTNYPVPHGIVVQGTGVAHRTHFLNANPSGGRINHFLLDQGGSVTTAATLISSASSYIYDFSIINNKAIVIYALASGIFKMLIGSTMNATPTWGSELGIESANTVDGYFGWSAASTQNKCWKILNRTLARNPSNENHALVVEDTSQPDGVSKALLTEICDITNYQGAQISQYQISTVEPLFDGVTTRVKLGQTFTTGTGTRVRTISVRASQATQMAAGYNMSCSIYATSGGFPTGSALYTSTNTVDPSKFRIEATHVGIGNIYFNFAGVSLSNSTVYAFVLETTSPVNANGIRIGVQHSSNLYAGGKYVAYDGTSWGDMGGGAWDLSFEINGEYVTDLSLAQSATDVYTALHSTVSPFNVYIHNQESQIVNIDSTTAQFITRRTPTNSDSVIPISGHPFRRVISYGTGGVKSVISDAVVAGYAPSNYDASLVINVSNGNPENARIDTTTGVVSTSAVSEDRSGISLDFAPQNIDATNYIADVDFQSGICINLNGSNEWLDANGTAIQDIKQGNPFAIEVEIKPTLTASDKIIVGKYSNGSGYGWYLFLNSSNFLCFQSYNSGGSTLNTYASDIAESSAYHKVRLVYDGTIVKLYRSTSAPFTTFTEVASYSAQNNIYTNVGGGASVRVGAVHHTGYVSHFSGKIGYVKMVNGSSSFNYNGYKSQPALVSIQNLGSKIAVKQTVGQISTTLSNPYNNAGIVDGNSNDASVVDSYDLVVSTGKTLGTAGNQLTVKESMGRGSNRNQSSLQGTIHKFNK